MQQSKLESLLESVVNVVLGFAVGLLSQIIVFPIVGLDVPISTNLEISAYFTLISLVRSYVIRRWFNAGLHKMVVVTAKRLATQAK